jgi:LPXTG-motif cell wall-anchored protein
MYYVPEFLLPYEVEVTLEAVEGVTVIHGINITVASNIRLTVEQLFEGEKEEARTLRADLAPGLKVHFAGPWNSVTNKPTLIFQTPTGESITLDGDVPAEDKITIVKTHAVDNRPPVPRSAPGDDNGGGPSTGEIVAIVIGVVAGVAIVAVAIWFFVIRRKKPDVGGSPP